MTNKPLKNKKMTTNTKRRPKATYKTVMCSKCNKMPMKIEETSKSGICWLCVTRMCEPPKMTSYQSSGRPRGWQFMHEYVDKEGNVFHRGVEQPKLKGTKPMTVPKKTITTKKKRINKKEKERIQAQAASELYNLKRDLDVEKRKTYRLKIDRKIKRLQKILK